MYMTVELGWLLLLPLKVRSKARSIHLPDWLRVDIGGRRWLLVRGRWVGPMLHCCSYPTVKMVRIAPKHLAVLVCILEILSVLIRR